MKWYERIIACHLAVTEAVSHAQKLDSDRYFVWQEDGARPLNADSCQGERVVTGTTDLFTKLEFDPWADAFASALDSTSAICWHLESVQFEEETGFWHYEWAWEVLS